MGCVCSHQYEGMFSGTTAFNGDISSWNVSAVTNMYRMFASATAFNGDLSSWNVSAVTIMERMFEGATAFNGDISSWDVSAVTYMAYMFLGCLLPVEKKPQYDSILACHKSCLSEASFYG